MKSLKQNYQIKAKIDKVWEALTNPKLIDKWGGGPAKMKSVKGFEFSLWGGDIFGVNTEIIKNKKLTQQWYGGKWEKPSIVTFLLSQNKNKTKVELIHKNIPDDEFEGIESGWKEDYMIPLKELVEEQD